MLDSRIITGFVGVIALTVAANLMLKLGAAVPAPERVFFGVFGWKSLLGLVLFGCGGIVYGVLLRSVPLNIAQAFTAMQFVGVILTANIVLSEPISPARWTGIFCISVGIVLVGLTTRA